MILLRSSRWPKKDILYRKKIVKQEITKIILRSLLSYQLWPQKYRFYFAKRLGKFVRYSSISHCRNNCSIMIFGRSTFKFSRMSRICTKYYASWGYIPGIRRSSF